MLIRVIDSAHFLPEMDLDMPQDVVHEEVFFDIHQAGSRVPTHRLIYRLVGFHPADLGQPCYEFDRIGNLFTGEGGGSSE
ncbi:TPA: hypothetical protein ACPWFJ_004735 [Pseudomonas aeruginosa]